MELQTETRRYVATRVEPALARELERRARLNERSLSGELRVLIRRALDDEPQETTERST